MSRFISVPVLWNNENSFQNNSLVSIDIASPYVATVMKPSKPYPPAQRPTLIPTLQINEPNFNTLYLNMPFAAYQAAIIAASAATSGSSNVSTNFYTISGTQSSITDASLSGASILLVWKNGTVLNDTDYSLSGSTISFTGPLAATDTVGIIYNFS